MNITTQRNIGILLVCVSALAMLVVGIVFSHARIMESGSSGNGFWTVSMVTFDISWRYWLPILICGVVGVVLFMRSSRKPPKLPG